jgi:hypothetical protein
MEKIVRKYLIFTVVTVLATFAHGQTPNSTVIDKTENFCNSKKAYHYYSIESPSKEKYTVSTEKMGIDTDKLNLHFFSEVDDKFIISVNGRQHLTTNVNTRYVDGGNTRVIRIPFPNGSESFTLKVTSLKYGCFETEVRKQHPMLYIKYFNNEWYLDHNTVFEIPYFYFLKDKRFGNSSFTRG